MIFRKSLSKKKGAAYSFFSGLSSAFVPAVLITAFLSLFMSLSPLLNFIEVNGGRISIGDNEVGAKARDSFKFFVFDIIDSDFTLYLIFGLLGILAIFTSVRIFSFICDKRTVNVYYSLGIKRSVLFMSKYLSGALLLCCATAAAVILSYFINLIFLGGSWQLSLVLLHFYCGISVFLLMCYSITAAVFSSVGTVSEAVVYSVAVLFAPTIIIFITEYIIAAFLPSSTLNMHFEYFNDRDYIHNNDASLLEATALYNPVLFFTEELKNFSCAYLEKGEVFLLYTKSGWMFPNLLIHIPWFIIAVTVGATGSVLFRRIKAENCGFLNTNKVLSNLTIFELCLIGSSLLLPEIEWNGVGITIGVGIAAAFVLYLVAEVFLKRNFLKILKSIYKFAAHMAVIAIIFTTCATGAFGYGEYIPDASKIESVEITVPLSYSQITTKNMSYGWMFDSFIKMYEQYRPCFMPVMTEPEDINTVIELNRRLIQIEKDDGIKNRVVIRYNLKSGGYSERCHYITSEDEFRLLFTIFDTKAYDAEINRLFNVPYTIDDLKAEQSRYGWVDDAAIKKLAFSYEFSKVTARPLSLQENKELNLTEEEFGLLKNAVYKDLSAQTGTEYLTASHRQLGVLSFGINEKAYMIEGINGYSVNNYYDEEISYPYEDEIVPDEPYDELFPEEYPEAFPEDVPEESPYTDQSFAPYSALGGFDYASDYDVIITENMTNTLSVLQSLGLSDCFKRSYEIECIAFREYDAQRLFGVNNTSDLIMEFFTYPVSREDLAYEYQGNPDFKVEDHYAENKITDKNKIAELDPLMRIHEFTFNSGYLCLVKYTDETYSLMYISRDDAPDYVRSFNYQKDSYYYYG